MDGRAVLAPGDSLVRLWERISSVPGGPAFFSSAVGRRVPYAGSIHPSVEELQAGYARVSMVEKHKLLDQRGWIHPIALANLGQLTSGLAVVSALPMDVQISLARIEADYAKPGHGTMTATCRCEVPAVDGPIELTVIADVRDDVRALVATVTATWRLDRRREPPAPAGNP